MPRKRPKRSRDVLMPSIRFSPTPRNSKKPTDIVDLRPLKRAVAKLPQPHPLQVMMAEEPDEMQFWEFSALAPRWVLLLTKWPDDLRRYAPPK